MAPRIRSVSPLATLTMPHSNRPRFVPTPSAVLTVLGAIVIAGGLVQMMVDDEVQVTAMPEPAPVERESPAEVVPTQMAAALVAR